MHKIVGGLSHITRKLENKLQLIQISNEIKRFSKLLMSPSKGIEYM